MNQAVVELGRAAFNGATPLVCELAYPTTARMAGDDELEAIFPGITLTGRGVKYAQAVESTDSNEEATDGLLLQLFEEHGEDVVAEVGHRLEEFTQGMVDMFGRRGALQ